MICRIALICLALCLTGCKFGPRMDPFYEAVLKSQPKNPGAVYLQGQHFYNQGQFKRAEAYFARATRITPSDPAGWIGLGQAELELGRPRLAERAFRRALGLSKDPLLDAQFGLASALVFQNKTEEAASQIGALEKNGATAATERLRGDLAFMGREYGEALAHYQKSLAMAGAQPDLQRRVEELGRYLGRKP